MSLLVACVEEEVSPFLAALPLDPTEAFNMGTGDMLCARLHCAGRASKKVRRLCVVMLLLCPASCPYLGEILIWMRD